MRFILLFCSINNYIFCVHIGYLYYLDPEAEQEFEEGLTAFLETAGIKASSARVLEDYVDDRSDEKKPAVFYLKLNDVNGTIVQAFFEKTSGHYVFAVSGTGEQFNAAVKEDGEEGRNVEVKYDGAFHFRLV